MRGYTYKLGIEIDELIEYNPQFILNPEVVMSRILKDVEFEQHKIQVYGKERSEPRLSAIFGDDITKEYTYSKTPRKIKKMPRVIEKLRDIIKETTGIHYDCVLVNYYRNGKDKIGWHSDNERMMDTNSIASISLGAERTFQMRDKLTKKIVFNEVLENGSLLLMKNNCQDELEHQLPPRPYEKKPRINLTFRRFK
jgi:alkylated DNA repair dioxygenase AlkB